MCQGQDGIKGVSRTRTPQRAACVDAHFRVTQTCRSVATDCCYLWSCRRATTPSSDVSPVSTNPSPA